MNEWYGGNRRRGIWNWLENWNGMRERVSAKEKAMSFAKCIAFWWYFIWNNLFEIGTLDVVKYETLNAISKYVNMKIDKYKWHLNVKIIKAHEGFEFTTDNK